MGNCAASKLTGGLGGGDDDDPVALCRDRKRLLKSAVARRAALAEAHANYLRSLHRVAAAVNLFILRHSAPAPILITLPPSDPSSSSSFLRQTPTEPKTQALPPCPSSVSSSSSSSPSSSPPRPSRMAFGEMGSGYFFAGAPPEPPPAESVFGWDFFNPFDAAAAVGGLCSEEELRVVRQEEGIPELEEEGGGVVVEVKKEEENGSCEVVRREVENGKEREDGERGLTVTEVEGRGTELLEALRKVEDQFIRAYDAGKEVAKMLEVNSSQLMISDEADEVKENSSKLIQAITWHRSTSSQSLSYKSYLASSSQNSSWSESRSDIYDDCSGMKSGSHSQTLGRLYAWEKKLYEEVKAGDHTRQMYEKKCLQLRNHDAKGADLHSVDKTRALVKDLHTRIWVALRSIQTISARIQKVRDEELQPQLIELLQGLTKSWNIMLISHETQKQIMTEVKTFTCSAYGKFCNDSLRQVTVNLEGEFQNWRACFMSYITAQRVYVEALDGWISKFFIADVEYYSRHRSSVPLYNRVGAPTLLIICHDWLNSYKKLPDKAVSYAMKGFIRDTREIWVKQGEEQQQKRKVDILAKELDRRVLAFQKAENKVLELKLAEHKPEPDVRDRVEYLAGRKDLLDMFRKKLEAEKAKHHDCMQETHRVTLNGFKVGLLNVFETLTEFSRDCVKLYDELLVHSEKGKEVEMAGKPSCIEGSQAEVGNGS